MANPNGPIDTLTNTWLTKLLDQSKRNRLLYFKPSKRGTLQLTSPSLSVIFNTICVEENSQSFWVEDTDDAPDDDLPINMATEAGFLCTTSQPANSLATAETRRKELATALRNLASKSRLELEDRGIRVLHIGFGVVEWQEKKQNEKIRSPVVMVPVKLSRASRQNPWELSLCDEDIVLNPVLAVKLQHDFDIHLPDVPEDWDECPLEQYLKSVQSAVDQFKWSVADECWLGLFSFSKLPMYRDLDKNREKLHQHSLITRLAGASTDDGEVLELTCESRELDRQLSPQDSFLVVDADSSQLAAIETVKMGTDLVLHGPPGTGKSQTITNVVAEMLAAGKSVLFVSEKMAALEVVFQRIEQVKLGHLCLELHSHKASRRTVVESLHQAMTSELMVNGGMSEADLDRLAQRREQLNQYVLALHEVRSPLEKSVFDVLGELAALKDAPRRKIDESWVTRMGPADYDWVMDMSARLKEVWPIALQGTNFPWYGYIGQVEEIVELNKLLQPPRETLKTVQASASAAAAVMGLPLPASLHEARLIAKFSKLCLRHVQTLDRWLEDGNGQQVVSLLETSRDGREQVSQLSEDILTRQGMQFIKEAGTSHKQALDEVLAVLSQRLGRSLDGDTRVIDLIRAGGWICGLRPILTEIINLAEQIAEAVGLGKQRLSLKRMEKYIKLGEMSLSEVRPLPNWLSRKGISEARNHLAAIKKRVEDWQQAEEELLKDFAPEVFEEDLEEMLVRYKTEYGGAFAWLRASYRRDARYLKKHAKRKLTKKMIIELLQKASQRQAAKKLANDHGSVLLSGYYRGLETDWVMIDTVFDQISEAVRWFPASGIPPKMIKVICHGEGDLDTIQTATESLRETVNGMARDAEEASLGDLEELQCDGRENFIQTDLEVLLKWLTEVEAGIAEPLGVVKDVYEIGAATALQSVDDLKDDISIVINLRKLEKSLETTDAELRVLCGDWFDTNEPDYDRLITAAQWAAETTDLLGQLNLELPADFKNLACSDAPWELTPAEQPVELQNAIQQAEAAMKDFDSNFDPAHLLAAATGLFGAPFDDAFARLEALADTANDVADWLYLCRTRESLLQRGMTVFAESLWTDPPSTEDLIECCKASLLRVWTESTFKNDDRLRDFRAEEHERTMEKFRNLDRNHSKNGAARVINRRQKRRNTSGYIPAGSERAILMREYNRQRRHLPIRKLFEAIPNLLSELKPCLLMSPLSVAQYLSPEMIFDLVVFDEASQICTEDAIGAIYRGRQVLICGDQKQLPPTNFFQKTIEDDDDQIATEEIEIISFQSLLDACLANGIAETSLRWHYRSRHEHLIAFSNARFYGNDLVTFPAAQHEDERLGVHLVHVPDGVYDRGGKRTNEVEADKVVDLVVEHLQRFPDKTLGVVSFSTAQTQAIEDKLEERASGDAAVDAVVAKGRQNGFFVKNLERVQGDERDVMIFSIGYGRDRTGRLTMGFGPLSQAGGERRLNVAITRAKEKVILVTSIKAGEIDAGPAKYEGVKQLHAYLDFAERGPVALLERQGSGGDYESPLEKEVADAIREMGYEVDPQVGCFGFRIDLGVKLPGMPGRYILGVECDGATYHSSYTARDRDRLRQQVLESLGWRIHRVWSPSWVHRRGHEIEKLRTILQEVELQPEPVVAEPVEDYEADTEEFKISLAPLPFDVQENGEAAGPTWAEPYSACHVSTQASRYYEFHDLDCLYEHANSIARIVAAEGPVHIDVVARRLADAWGLTRVGPRMKKAIESAARLVVKKAAATRRGDFLWPTGEGFEPRIRQPVENEPASERKVEQIAPEEIALAMERICRDGGGIEKEALLKETARVFGFKRMVPTVLNMMQAALNKAVAQGSIIERESKFIAP